MIERKSRKSRTRALALQARAWLSLLICALLSGVADPALAFKPKTHMHLAEAAVADALDDGMVEIALVDFKGQGRIGTIGRYQVDRLILEALRNHMAQFRAGVIGPDAYPDLLAGQSVIHPADEGRGSDAWLQMLWDNKRSPAERAFVVGFLAHSAGDMYGHSMVNHYAGGPFTTDPVDNAIIHTLVEGYISSHTPAPATFGFSIAGVEDFIYANLVDARRSTPTGSLYRQMLDGKEKGASTLPYFFSSLRDDLEDFVTGYYDQIRDYDEQIAAASFPEDGILLSIRTAYAAALGPAVTYSESWILDIDTALRRLPFVSTELAEAVVYNPSGVPDLPRADAILREYWLDYAASAVGAPDGLSQFPVPVLDQPLGDVVFDVALRLVAERLRSEFEGDLLRFMQENGLLIAALPVALLLGDPGAFVDAQLGKKQEIDEAMGITAGDFDWNQFAAAFNTVAMIKLALLGPAELQRLMRDLGYPPVPSTLVPNLNDIQNAMLGFHKSMDHSRQWRDNFDKMVGHWDCHLYQKMFMNQIGDHEPAEAERYHYLSYPGGPGTATSDRNCPLIQDLEAPTRVCAVTIESSVLQLDSDPDRYHAVTDLAYAGGLQGPEHLFMSRARVRFSIASPPVRSPQAARIVATRQNSITRAIELVPPAVSGTVIEDDRGNLFAYGRDGRVLGGTTLDMTVRLDCNNIPPGTSISLSVCPLVEGPATSPANICPVSTLSATGLRQDYGFSSTLPDVGSDADYVVTAGYLASSVPQNIRVLSSRVKSLTLAPSQVTLSLIRGANPVLQATLHLVTPAATDETIHLEFFGLASAIGQYPAADVVVPAGTSRLVFPVTIPTQGIVANSFYSAAGEGILTALSERDPADVSERKRMATVILLNPTSGDFHGSPEEDPRLEAFASGCWQLGLPGPRCELSSLSLWEQESGQLWVVNPRDLGLDASSRFGGRVEFVGDRNSDGVPDLVVASPNGAGPGIKGRSGAVFLLSGRNGSLLAHFAGSKVNERYGASLARFGADRLAIGAPGSGAMAGRVEIVNLGYGRAERVHTASQGGDRFGSTLASTRIGDDASLLIGAPGNGQRSGGPGAVYVAHGPELRLFARGEAKGDGFGQSLASAEDFGWVVVGAPQAARGAGTVSMLSQAGKLQWKVAGDQSGAQVGADVAALPIGTPDGKQTEFVVGAPGLSSRASNNIASDKAGGAYIIDMQGSVKDIQRGGIPGARLGEFVGVGPQSQRNRHPSFVLSGGGAHSRSILSFRTQSRLK